MGVIFSAMNRDHNLCGIREVMVGGPAGAGRLWDWKRNRKPSPRRRLKQWLKHQKENLRLVILLHLLPPLPPPLLTLQERDSEQHTDSSFSIPPPQVGWSTRRGGRSRRKLYSVLFLALFHGPTYFKFQMWALKKPQIFYSLVWLWNM